jgi:precorrin-6A/cobalt-precorrin-6A reductase
VILLLGGTSETAGLAEAMRAAGWGVLVSTATDAALALPPGVERRCGRLDAGGLAGLCRDRGIRVLVDASHPFATALHAEAAEAARRAAIPWVRFARPAGPAPAGAILAADHPQAARLAFEPGKPVLLTIGSRHLEPYVREARGRRLPVLARILDHPESLAACREAGLGPEEIVTGRGPFSTGANLALLRRLGAGALVSKDSGAAGGLDGKAEAARIHGARLVLIRRPDEAGLDAPALLEAVRRSLAGPA